MANKYQDVAPKISAVLAETEIETEILKDLVPAASVTPALTKEAVQEAIKYLKYFGASVVQKEGVSFVSHGFADIVNKLKMSGHSITEKQVQELYNEWKMIVTTKKAAEEAVAPKDGKEVVVGEIGTGK